jgi:hypothetical protein
VQPALAPALFRFIFPTSIFKTVRQRLRMIPVLVCCFEGNRTAYVARSFQERRNFSM